MCKLNINKYGVLYHIMLHTVPALVTGMQNIFKIQRVNPKPNFLVIDL